MGQVAIFDYSNCYGSGKAGKTKHTVEVDVSTLHNYLKKCERYISNTKAQPGAQLGYRELTNNLVAAPHAIKASADRVMRQLNSAAQHAFKGAEHLYNDGAAAAATQALKGALRAARTDSYQPLQGKITDAKDKGNKYLQAAAKEANLEAQITWAKSQAGTQKLQELRTFVMAKKGALKREARAIKQQIQAQEQELEKNRAQYGVDISTDLNTLAQQTELRAKEYDKINSQIDKFYEDKLRELNPENEYRQAKEKSSAAYTTALQANQEAIVGFKTLVEKVEAAKDAAFKKAVLKNTDFSEFKADGDRFKEQDRVVVMLSDFSTLRPPSHPVVQTSYTEEEERRMREREETERQVKRNMEGNLEKLKTD